MGEPNDPFPAAHPLFSGPPFQSQATEHVGSIPTGSICRRKKREKGRARHERKKGGNDRTRSAVFFFFPSSSALFRRGIRGAGRGAGCPPSTRLRSTLGFHRIAREDRNRIAAQQGTDRTALDSINLSTTSFRRERGSQPCGVKKASGKMAPRGGRRAASSLFLSAAIDEERSTTIDAREEQGKQKLALPTERGGLARELISLDARWVFLQKKKATHRRSQSRRRRRPWRPFSRRAWPSSWRQPSPGTRRGRAGPAARGLRRGGTS